MRRLRPGWLPVLLAGLFAMPGSPAMAQDRDELSELRQRLERYEQRLTTIERDRKIERGGDWTDKVSVHGFLSAGALRSDLDARRPVAPGSPETTDVSSPEGATRNWSHQGLSRAGIQVSAGTSADTEVVVQLLSKGANEFDTEAQWAYFSYRVAPSLKLRGGRLTIPFYMHSQYINVGYAYPWAVPPQEVYNTVPADRFEGFDLLWDFSTGELAHTLNLLWGSTDVMSDLANQPTRFRVDNLGVANLTSSWQDLSLRLSYAGGEVTVDQLPAPLDSWNQSLNGALAFDDAYAWFANAGFQYDNGRWLLLAEKVELGFSNWFPRRQAGYVTLGRRFGSWLPLLTWATLDTTESSDQYFPGLDSCCGPEINARAFQSRLHERQKSWTAGLRFDVTSGMAVKAEVSRYFDFSNDGLGTDGHFDGAVTDEAPVHVFRFVVDLVF